MPTFGGNSVINGGEMTAVGAPQQKDAGIKNSLDLWMKDTVTAGLGLNQMDKAKELADNMMVCYEWLKNEMGVKFMAFLIYWHGASQTLGRGFLKDWDRSLNF